MPKEHNAAYYCQRASAGLIISEATVISEQGNGWSGAAAIYKPEHVSGWAKVTSAVHQKGGVIFCQLWHMGRVTSSKFHGLQPVSASAIAATGNAWCHNKEKVPYEEPRALDETEIPAVVAEYRHAAQCAKEAGFDGVEIHAANGYLIDQFLQSSTNKRSDAFGGSPENRMRLLNLVIAACETVFETSCIAVRLSPNGSFGSMGSDDNFASFSYFIEHLPAGLAYAHIVDGLAFGFHEKDRVFRAYDARRLYPGVIIGNCGYSQDMAQGVIDAGCLDAVAFGRPFIGNPDLVERFRNKWPLAPLPEFPLWYEAPGDDFESPAAQAMGYSDFPSYVPEDKPDDK